MRHASRQPGSFKVSLDAFGLGRIATVTDPLGGTELSRADSSDESEFVAPGDAGAGF